MAEEKLEDILDEMSEEDVATLLEFVDRVGSFEDAQAAIDMLSQIREAA